MKTSDFQGFCYSFVCRHLVTRTTSVLALYFREVGNTYRCAQPSQLKRQLYVPNSRICDYRCVHCTAACVNYKAESSAVKFNLCYFGQ